MDYDEALRRGATRCGILPEYIDTWGHPQAPSEAATRGILAALGAPTGSAGELERFLDAREAEAWSRPLDAAVVVRESTDVLPLRIPVERAGASVKLEIEWEGGELQHRWFWLPELPSAAPVHAAGREYLEKRLPLPGPLRLGYHTIRVYWMNPPELNVFATARFIVCPENAYRLDGRMAGLAVSLYGLRSERNWGIGDLTDLAAAIDVLAPAGVAFVLLNPLHAIANRQPYNISPYLPESSLYRNFLYLDTEKAPGYQRDESLHAEAEALRTSEFVEYERVAEVKLRALEAAFERFLASGSAPEFDAYVHAEGRLLDEYAVYCALGEELHRRDPNVWIWTQWPEAYQDPRSSAVEEFARAHGRRILFFKFLQWELDRQLADVQARALQRGMRLGLCHDLALATDRYGSDLWAHRGYFVPGCRVGAPPDAFAPNGQDWGFPPPNGDAHRSDGYELFAQTIRKVARHGGALRIDHVMRFFRLYWIPDELSAADGAYVRNRADDLLGILALESVRNRFMVIGEDLGTVEGKIRERLAEASILGYRVLWFERDDDGSFLGPGEYPAQAAVTTSTHDLPTLAGFFTKRDIEARKEAGLIDEAAYAGQSASRDRDIERLKQALAEAGFADDPLGFVLSAACELAIVNQEDLTGETEQQNLPASTWQYPNWSRKMTVAGEDLGPLAAALRERIRQAKR